jgi:isocitrate dehydrogenase
MRVHVGQATVAELIKNAWLCTLESGLHTADFYRHGLSKRHVGTDAFTTAIIERLGERPRQLEPVSYRPGGISIAVKIPPRADKALVGVDVFVDWDEAGRDAAALGRRLEGAVPAAWTLTMITNRGVKVYPDGMQETFCTDHWRCRFVRADGGRVATFGDVLELLGALHGAALDVIKTEHLYTFNGVPGYSLGQGE